MARKRMIDPSIWESEDFSKLSYLGRLLWIGLFSNADDEGRGKANVAYLKSHLFAYDEELSVNDVEKALKEIENKMSIRFYEVDGKRFYQLTKWDKFQTINKPTPSQIPAENMEKEEQDLTSKVGINDNYGSTTVVVSDECVPKKEIEIEEEIKLNKENSLTRVKESEQSSLSLPDKKVKHKYGQFKNVLLTEDEYNRLIARPDGKEAIEYLSYHREMKGYKCKSDNLAIQKWVFDALKEERQRKVRLNGTQKQTAQKESPMEQLGRVLGDLNE